ncbi:MAG TPA: cyclopropane-fatty-acyl-phospholipid synthase family protein [Sulfurovum sp.]|jgi:cyclopropane-fatty-acyl-phospholipid synthase|nr:MAG: cyclopropane-fatty-acyl-phospholipid synthase [Sulfurovum sp. 35-42-20]OYZ24756.1 MAG: cyclopropane-fatty-acyl-phospholipid synthase [Sulfurovum sp. 16-42-52]OYZ49284.1 MAG: cyclopropane-fatty-acyl-phospholipid synthase [Sulfurovum sp. 24-42-9]OZA44719.1 MAG: cyclopropane-fatty-acyl-phospholipid synthase [Sulfurovum sp. 17-42-90]OZA59271.1 MAG: cyclopropane-fatty-acyl-phospholipid synthase [Sulfurovum sp. 39-42-12]HQR74143.1 cyclopropane-fatty-acyl-phospholipid synthase family protein 
MKKFWNKLGDSYFSRIELGTLHVTYSNGTQKTYGNGELPEISMDIKKSRFFKRLFLYGDIGFSESYMDGDFEASDLPALITLFLNNSKTLAIKSEDKNANRLVNLLPQFNKIKHWMRKNSKTRSQKNISEHYDLSNDFFSLMLDETMMYSSAVFKKPDESLHEAQKRKIALLADKLRIQKGAKVLEIGSGWGAMAIHLAKERDCDVTTVTLSKEQKALCEERFKKEEIEKQVEVLLKDYRDLEGTFDAIIAVEMFEAVGKEYFDVFFKKCESLLKPSGVLVMQIITMPDQRYAAYAKGTDFIQKYIFPGGHLPSLAKILETTSSHTRLNLLHMEEYTEDYAKTIQLWHEAFLQKLDEVKKLGFDDYFIRMWKMYLSYCEAAFVTRNINLVQVAFTRDQNTHLNKGLVA